MPQYSIIPLAYQGDGIALVIGQRIELHKPCCEPANKVGLDFHERTERLNYLQICHIASGYTLGHVTSYGKPS